MKYLTYSQLTNIVKKLKKKPNLTEKELLCLKAAALERRNRSMVRKLSKGLDNV